MISNIASLFYFVDKMISARSLARTLVETAKPSIPIILPRQSVVTRRTSRIHAHIGI